MKIEKRFKKFRFYLVMFQPEPTSPCKNTLSGGIGTGDQAGSLWLHFKLFGIRILIISLGYCKSKRKSKDGVH
ncbi:hypothetical protein LCGC14_1316180 [marine sediment metagenome]|uniref:Uncharacterized protein n=1 Tax=marine sediment metagenome TaxID=412755 RepID=A0A0F9KL04_9ZZZZ